MGLAQGGISSVATVALLLIETCRPRQRSGLLSSQPHWLQPLPGLTVSQYHSITVASFLATGDSSLEKEEKSLPTAFSTEMLADYWGPVLGTIRPGPWVGFKIPKAARAKSWGEGLICLRSPVLLRRHAVAFAAGCCFQGESHCCCPAKKQGRHKWLRVGHHLPDGRLSQSSWDERKYYWQEWVSAEQWKSWQVHWSLPMCQEQRYCHHWGRTRGVWHRTGHRVGLMWRCTLGFLPNTPWKTWWQNVCRCVNLSSSHSLVGFTGSPGNPGSNGPRWLLCFLSDKVQKTYLGRAENPDSSATHQV